MEINVSIVGKIIGKAIISTVAIAKENKFGIVIKNNGFGLFISPIQSIPGRHKTIFIKYPKNVQNSLNITLT